MESLKELFRIGNGPSSSHTMGPKKIVEEFIKRYPGDDYIDVTLYGSLDLTGKGHLTDVVIDDVLKDKKHKINFDIKKKVKHPNTMLVEGYLNNKKVHKMIARSVGGGAIEIDGEKPVVKKDVYPLNNFEQISTYCKEHNLRLYEYVDECEPEIGEYLKEVMQVMSDAVHRGLEKEGALPGKLQVQRKAKKIAAQNPPTLMEQYFKNILSYCFAVSEENASGGLIVTAPTCGACGVIPGVLMALRVSKTFTEEQLLNGLKTAGLIGNLLKTNASISGAVAGCQAEVGSACSMAAALIAEVNGKDIETIAHAAELAMEHHLGLTCDPVMGYVQIPCISRNGLAAVRAFSSYSLACYIEGVPSSISFDEICEIMLKTGMDLSSKYRETSSGGLAKLKKSIIKRLNAIDLEVNKEQSEEE